MPILATLDRVGPDIHDLLDVTRDLRQAILGLPGFAFFPPPRRGSRRARSGLNLQSPPVV